MASETPPWDSAAILGWGLMDDPEYGPDLLVQVRMAQQKARLVDRPRPTLLVRSEAEEDLVSCTWTLGRAKLAVLDGTLRFDMAAVDSISRGTCVSVVAGDDAIGVWRTNSAHGGVLLDRIASGELDPSAELLRCFEGTPRLGEKLDQVRRAREPTMGQIGRIPTESQRVSRLNHVVEREALQKRVAMLNALGDEQAANALSIEVLRLLKDSVKRRNEEFGHIYGLTDYTGFDEAIASLTDEME